MIKILIFVALGYLLYRMVIRPALAPPKDEADRDKIIIDKDRHKTNRGTTGDDYVDYEEIDD